MATDRVDMEANVLGQLAGIWWSVRLLEKLEDTKAAWVTQGTVEPRLCIEKLRARSSCHDLSVSA